MAAKFLGTRRPIGTIVGEASGAQLEIIHRKGRRRTNVNALSRLPFSQCGRDRRDTPAALHHIAVTSLQVPQIPGMPSVREEQLADTIMGMLLSGKEAALKPTVDGKCMSYLPTPADMGSVDCM